MQIADDALPPTLSLLVIDAEGYDFKVLRAFPFGSVRVSRVIYESMHLSKDDRLGAARLLHAHGFTSVLSPLSPSRVSVWHRNGSRERVRRRRRNAMYA